MMNDMEFVNMLCFHIHKKQKISSTHTTLALRYSSFITPSSTFIIHHSSLNSSLIINLKNA